MTVPDTTAKIRAIHHACLTEGKPVLCHMLRGILYFYTYVDEITLNCADNLSVSLQKSWYTHAGHLMAPCPPWLSLGVKRERQTRIGGGVTTEKDKEQSLFFFFELEGAKGLWGPLLNTGLPLLLWLDCWDSKASASIPASPDQPVYVTVN